MQDLYLIITQKLIILKSSRFHADFMWNPVDFMKSLVIAPTLHSSNWRVFAETLAFIILGGFHRWNVGEICWISQVKSLVIAPTLHSSNWRVFAETLAFIILVGFHRWNLGEIYQISWLKSTRFQGEIHQISRVKSPTLHSSNWRVFAKTLAFIILGGFHRSNLGEICQISWMKSTRFQGEILGHSPHPAFIKLKSFCWNTCFYNFGWISQVKSGWNLPDFMGEIHHFSWWNLVDFTGGILGHSPHPAFIKLKSSCWNTCFYNLGWISQVKSGWNPPDFTGEIHHFSGWNPLDFKGEIPHPAFIKLKSFCWNTCFYNFGWISQVKSGWNPPDFTGEIHQISRWNPPPCIHQTEEFLLKHLLL